MFVNTCFMYLGALMLDIYLYVDIDIAIYNILSSGLTDPFIIMQ